MLSIRTRRERRLVRQRWQEMRAASDAFLGCILTLPRTASRPGSQRPRQQNDSQSFRDRFDSHVLRAGTARGPPEQCLVAPPRSARRVPRS